MEGPDSGQEWTPSSSQLHWEGGTLCRPHQHHDWSADQKPTPRLGPKAPTLHAGIPDTNMTRCAAHGQVYSKHISTPRSASRDAGVASLQPTLITHRHCYSNFPRQLPPDKGLWEPQSKSLLNIGSSPVNIKNKITALHWLVHFLGGIDTCS